MGNKDKQKVADELIEDELEVEEVELEGEDDTLEESLTYEELLDRVQELEGKNVNLADQYLRSKAETDNTRRIADVEVKKARKFALEAFAKELLPVMDSLEQAALVKLDDDAGKKVITQMQEGLALTTRQLESAFEKFHIEEVSPEVGDELDPEVHQPMAMQPSDEVAANKILTAIQKGFTLNERLLRPAMVLVSSGKKKA